MADKVLNKLLEQFKNKEMTVEYFCDALKKPFPDLWVEFAGTVFKCDKYYFKISYLDNNEDFDRRKIKIIDVFSSDMF